MMKVKIGEVYQHFKGNIYEVIAVAKDCEDLKEIVVYKNIEKGDLWTRPLTDFCEIIEKDGKQIKRFKKYQGEKI